LRASPILEEPDLINENSIDSLANEDS